MSRFCSKLLGVAVLAIPLAVLAADRPRDPSPEVKTALARINADSLRGHVSFLASDLLEGRATPSRGLDIAAEYIAAQFRRAGLEPAGDAEYFQTAKYLSLAPNAEGLNFQVTGTGAVDPSKVTIETVGAISVRDGEAIKWGEHQNPEGKVVFIRGDFRAVRTARNRLAGSKVALLVIAGPPGFRLRTGPALVPEEDRSKTVSVLWVDDDDLASKVKSASAGPLPFRVTVNVAAPVEKAVTLRNVVGILRGSDPALKNTYAMVTCHYDHLGVTGGAEGSRIYNGANDDASGTASVIDIAGALGGMNPHPLRSIVFAAFFGEESGLLGSRWYGAHPRAPLGQTVADVNLEQMGRTDSDLGDHVNMVNFTGFDFSNIPAIFKQAGELTDIRVVKDRKNSDAYFARSDNQALADLGIPAHTISVAYEFPDYHRVGDTWPKLDYENMARVDRMVALGLYMIAENPQPPHWNDESKTKKYVEAAEKLRAK